MSTLAVPALLVQLKISTAWCSGPTEPDEISPYVLTLLLMDTLISLVKISQLDIVLRTVLSFQHLHSEGWICVDYGSDLLCSDF